MNKFYLIQDVKSKWFWNNRRREFYNYIDADRFSSEEKLLNFAKKENIGIFKITEVYDTK